MVRFDIRADKTALLIIDMQNAFVKPGSPVARARGPDLVPRLNKVIQACRKKAILTIFTQHMLRADGSDVGLFKEFLPAPAVKALTAGTPGVAIYPEMEQHSSDITIPKQVYDAFLWTELDLILRNKGIDTLIIGGLDTLLCCESTVRASRHRNYKVIFLSDGTSTGDWPDMGWGAISADDAQKFALTIIAARFAEVASVAEVLRRIQRLG